MHNYKCNYIYRHIIRMSSEAPRQKRRSRIRPSQAPQRRGCRGAPCSSLENTVKREMAMGVHRNVSDADRVEMIWVSTIHPMFYQMFIMMYVMSSPPKKVVYEARAQHPWHSIKAPANGTEVQGLLPCTLLWCNRILQCSVHRIPCGDSPNYEWIQYILRDFFLSGFPREGIATIDKSAEVYFLLGKAPACASPDLVGKHSCVYRWVQDGSRLPPISLNHGSDFPQIAAPDHAT